MPATSVSCKHRASRRRPRGRAGNQVVTQVIAYVDWITLRAFIHLWVVPDVPVYTDDWHSYRGLVTPHRTVNHRAQEYVRGDVHTNGVFLVPDSGGYLRPV